MWKTAFHRVIVISIVIVLMGIGYFYWSSSHESTVITVSNDASPTVLNAVKPDDDASNQTDSPNEDAGVLSDNRMAVLQRPRKGGARSTIALPIVLSS